VDVNLLAIPLDVMKVIGCLGNLLERMGGCTIRDPAANPPSGRSVKILGVAINLERFHVLAALKSDGFNPSPLQLLFNSAFPSTAVFGVLLFARTVGLGGVDGSRRSGRGRG
jgi:hypothetical protein